MKDMTPTPTDITTQIIDQKLTELAQTPTERASGRRLSPHPGYGHELPLSVEEFDAVLTHELRRMIERIGGPWVAATPAITLEQVILTAIRDGKDPSETLLSLLQSFTVAYATPETHASACAHMQGLAELLNECRHDLSPGARRH